MSVIKYKQNGQVHTVLTGGVDSVSYGEVQSLTSEQKETARQNIGVAEIPEVTTTDNGKFLRVVNGEWAAQAVPAAEDNAF